MLEIPRASRRRHLTTHAGAAPDFRVLEKCGFLTVGMMSVTGMFRQSCTHYTFSRGLAFVFGAEGISSGRVITKCSISFKPARTELIDHNANKFG